MVNENEPLSLEREIYLINRIENNDTEAYGELFGHMQKMARFAAFKYSKGSDLTIDDLMTSADVPFSAALNTFQLGKGNRFSSGYFGYLGTHFERETAKNRAISSNYDVESLIGGDTAEDLPEALIHEDTYDIEADLEGRISTSMNRSEPQTYDESINDFQDKMVNNVAIALSHGLKMKEILKEYGITNSDYLRARRIIVDYYKKRLNKGLN